VKSRVKLLQTNIAAFVLLVVLTELLYSTFAWLFFSPDDIWIYENVGQTVQFDSVRGYSLARTPSRFARISNGEIEYVGSFSGNAQGLPDRDDFSILHPGDEFRRYAVFGDSYTAAQYLAINWPDMAEDILKENGKQIQLLNFSTHGGGLANWASNLAGILVKDNYRVDGLIFAVFDDDLERTFTLADGTGRDKLSFGRIESWQPADYPASREAATALLDKQEINASYILSSDKFDAALAGTWHPDRYWEFRILKASSHHLSRLWQALQDHLTFSPGQLNLIDPIWQYVTQNDLPVLVIYLPAMAEATGATSYHYQQAANFATLLDADFLDGRQAFEPFTRVQLQHQWFKHDAHWNQQGSDTFAAFIARFLVDWPEKTPSQ
jgi:hypothetical protein